MSTAVIDIQKLLDIDPSNGKPVVRGSRLRVSTLAARHLEGRPPEEITGDYPNLTVPAVYAALAYYHAHRPEVDADEEREGKEALEWARSHGAEIV